MDLVERLEQQEAEIADRATTAVLLVHGIGIQNRFDFLSSFVEGVVKATKRVAVALSKQPKGADRRNHGGFLLPVAGSGPQARTIANGMTVLAMPDLTEERSSAVDVYESYWSPLMTGATTIAAAFGFVVRTGWRLSPFTFARRPSIRGLKDIRWLRWLGSIVSLGACLALLVAICLFALSSLVLIADLASVTQQARDEIFDAKKGIKDEAATSTTELFVIAEHLDKLTALIQAESKADGTAPEKGPDSGMGSVLGARSELNGLFPDKVRRLRDVNYNHAKEQVEALCNFLAPSDGDLKELLGKEHNLPKARVEALRQKESQVIRAMNDYNDQMLIDGLFSIEEVRVHPATLLDNWELLPIANRFVGRSLSYVFAREKLISPRQLDELTSRPRKERGRQEKMSSPPGEEGMPREMEDLHYKLSIFPDFKVIAYMFSTSVLVVLAAVVVLMWSVGYAFLRATFAAIVDFFSTVGLKLRGVKGAASVGVAKLAYSLLASYILLLIATDMFARNILALYLMISLGACRLAWWLATEIIRDTVGDVDVYVESNANAKRFRVREAVLDRVRCDIEKVASEYDQVVVVAHSLGSQVALEALRQLHFKAAAQERLDPQGPVPAIRRVRTFITMGSPVDKIRCFFSAGERQGRFGELRFDVDEAIFSPWSEAGPPTNGKVEWLNAWNFLDPISDDIRSAGEGGQAARGGGPNTVVANRHVSMRGLWTHSKYWQDPAFVSTLAKTIAR